MFEKLMKSIEHQTSFDLMIEVAEYISIYMVKNHLNKTETAKLFNISRQYLYEILCCKKTPTLDLIIHIAKVMGQKVELKFVDKGK